MLSTVYQTPKDDTTPRHIAIIMDGNGRWARGKNLPRIAGHKKGAQAIREAMEACRTHGVHYLTLYAFSSENWKRPAKEIGSLMELLRLYLGRELDRLHTEGVALRVIGDRSRLEADIQDKINYAEALTATNNSLVLTIALSYGSRQELVHAAKALCQKVADGQVSLESIDEESFAQCLYTAGVPEPDLLIRTGGEQRLSNFLLWQAAYTELFFTEVLWPDFTAGHMTQAISEFSKRERRYGTA